MRCLAFASLICISVFLSSCADGRGGSLPPSPVSSSSSCLNPVLTRSGALVGGNKGSDVTKGMKLLQVTDMQRHTDRWMYQHDLIYNRCWKKQLNSTASRMKSECDYERSTIWEDYGPAEDPYAAPAFGNCFPMQAVQMGIRNAYKLGQLMRKEYGHDGVHPLLAESCPKGSVFMAVDAVQKNEQTAQAVFRGLCNRNASLEEFPSRSTLVRSEALNKTPFWLQSGLCAGPQLDKYRQEAYYAMITSAWWEKNVSAIAREAASITSHSMPSPYEYAALIDNIIDCTVCHACLGLQDVPKELVDTDFLPGQTGLFDRMNLAETASRAWPFNYFRNKSFSADFLGYSQLQYGYYFVVLLDRMQAAVDAVKAGRSHTAPQLYIQVMSDSNLTPQLAMLGLGNAVKRRPPYLSTLITELWVEEESKGQDAKFWVSMAYNGEIQYISHDSKTLTSWEKFKEALLVFAPRREACPQFYEHYTISSSLKLPSAEAQQLYE